MLIQDSFESGRRVSRDGSSRVLRRLGFLCAFGLLGLGLSLGASGCALLATTASVVASSSESKQKDLHERLTKFHQELYWGTGSRFLEFIDESKRQDIGRQIMQEQGVAKFVDFQVQNMKADPENSHIVDVEVKVRTYNRASLTVSERFEKETWEYHRFGGGWLLREREISPTPPLG